MLQPPSELGVSGGLPGQHRPLSQSGQWEQLQHEWTQQQSFFPPHPVPHPYYSSSPYSPYAEPYASSFPSFPPPSPAPPLVLRIALTPTESVDLPLDLHSYPPPDPSSITAAFCAQHRITDESRQRKLHAMIASHLQLAQAQTHPDPSSAYPPLSWDELPHPSMSSSHSPYPYPDAAFEPSPYSDGAFDGPLQPTFAPTRPSSAQSHSRSPSSAPRPSSSRASSRPPQLTAPPSPSADASSSPALSPRSLQLLRSHRPQYLQSPASQRLYAHASVRAHQSAQRALEHATSQQAKADAELAHCTFHPEVRGVPGLPPGQRRSDLLDDWDGRKRQQRLQRLQLQHRRDEAAQLPFHPALNAVSRELATCPPDPTRRKRPAPTPTPEPPPPSSADPEVKRERIRLFLARTAERQRRKAAAVVAEAALPSFAPVITQQGQGMGGGGRGAVSAGERKRRRKCEEIFHVYQTTAGFIPRSRFLSLVKHLTRSVEAARGQRMKADITGDDVAVLQLIIKECDREVRRVRKMRSEQGEMEVGEDLTWRLSLDDLCQWFERMWAVVVGTARAAEDAEQRMVHKFTAPTDA